MRIHTANFNIDRLTDDEELRQATGSSPEGILWSIVYRICPPWKPLEAVRLPFDDGRLFDLYVYKLLERKPANIQKGTANVLRNDTEFLDANWCPMNRPNKDLSDFLYMLSDIGKDGTVPKVIHKQAIQEWMNSKPPGTARNPITNRLLNVETMRSLPSQRKNRH